MADQHYDLFLTGQLAMGADRERALSQLAALFKRPPEQMEKLLQGRSRRIRKNLSAEQLQRLQQGFDKLGILTESRPSATASAQQQAVEQHARSATESLSLSPVGSPVLRDQERQKMAPVEVDTSKLHLDAPGARLQDATTEAATAPDTSHLQLLPQQEVHAAGTQPSPHQNLDELCGHLSLAEPPST